MSTPTKVDHAAVAFEAAKLREPEECAAEFGDGSIQLLVSWCAELGRLGNSDEGFFLSCRKVSEFMPDVPYRTAAIWLRQLCREGVLKLVRQGTKTRASRYQYVGNRR